ncbi:hypothetical protein D5S18_00310 [Nocardia panacis]|uniref:Uncharacterized protein n=1 Tax=Nocardia panacis TaxID=2340916 RepID=A0A3A4L1D1_9NOCA|nr:hypothetical protein D5S18_00310 [Nocardia panacis]
MVILTTDHPAVGLSLKELRDCRFAVAEQLHYRRRIGAPIPAWLRRLHDRLDAELRARMSADGPEPEAAQQDSEMIGTPEAATILECTARHVRRLAADLDGQRIGREWIFHRGTVTEYARARKEHPPWPQTRAS